MEAIAKIRLPDWRWVLTHLIGAILLASTTLWQIEQVWKPAEPIPLNRASVYEIALVLGFPYAVQQHDCMNPKYGFNRGVNCDRQEIRNFYFWRMLPGKYVKIAAPAFWFIYYSGAKLHAAHRGVPLPVVNAHCPQPLDANDGCTASQLNGSSGANANILTQANNNVPYASPYPNNAPLRDYAIGYDNTLTLTPAALWVPPPSYHCGSGPGTGNTFFCNYTAATCGDLCDIMGIAFLDYRVVRTGPGGGTGTWRIWNNRFKNGPTIALANGAMFATGSSNFNISVKWNEFDGDSKHYAFISGLSIITRGVDQAHPVTVDILYNDFHDIPARAMNVDATWNVKNVNWNGGRHLNDDYWAVQNVSVDATANTITFAGPMYNAGSGFIHPPQSGGSDCRRFNTGGWNGGVTAVAGTIGSQISGTPGGLGVYNFTGATGNLTNVTMDCGSSLHGEFDGMGIANNSLANEMNYIGNTLIYGGDCAPLNTGLLVYLATNGLYTRIGKSVVSNNILINRISGNGTWGGCAAHSWANNAPTGYNDLTIKYNWLDVTAVGAPGGATSSGCFYNPAGQSFVGSQSGAVTTVTSTSPAGPMPIGVQLKQSNVNYGTVTSQISVNADGTGTYGMSDSRTQSFASGGQRFAPNLATSGGAIPYAPAFPSSNVNMSDGNIFTISDGLMTTSSVACHA